MHIEEFTKIINGLDAIPLPLRQRLLALGPNLTDAERMQTAQSLVPQNETIGKAHTALIAELDEGIVAMNDFVKEEVSKRSAQSAAEDTAAAERLFDDDSSAAT